MQVIEMRARLKGRGAYRNRTWLKLIRADRREGRIMRQVRRAFIARGRPLTTGELLDWCYGRPRKHWHYAGVYRAAPRYAVKANRIWLPRCQSVAKNGGASK
jgi:hypothetical protein